MKQMGQWAYIFMKRCFLLKEQSSLAKLLLRIILNQTFHLFFSRSLPPSPTPAPPPLPAFWSSEFLLNILKVEQDSMGRRGEEEEKEEREPWRQTFLCRIWYLDPKPLNYKLKSKFIFVFSFETFDQVPWNTPPLLWNRQSQSLLRYWSEKRHTCVHAGILK